MVSSNVTFFFNDTATTEIYTLSLHDALPILGEQRQPKPAGTQRPIPANAIQQCRKAAQALPESVGTMIGFVRQGQIQSRSEEHTSELQSRLHLVCRLLLEK